MENEKKLPTKKKKSYVGRWIKLIWLGFIGIVAAIVALFFSISQGFLGEMPDMKDIENPDIYVASEIISSDGVVLGKFEKDDYITILNTIDKVDKAVNHYLQYRNFEQTMQQYNG